MHFQSGSCVRKARYIHNKCKWTIGGFYDFSGINEPASTPSSKRRTATVRVNDAMMEEIKGVCADMGASDWRVRHKGITLFQEMTENSPEVIGQNIVKVNNGSINFSNMCDLTAGKT